MSIETHYVCDFCDKRQVENGQQKSEELKNWWCVHLYMNNVYNPMAPSAIPGSQWAYACSLDCVNKLIEKMQQAVAKAEASQ